MKGLSMLRKQRRLSQIELALAIGVDSNSISRYERGIVKPTVDMAQKFANFFNVSVDELLRGPVKNEFKINFVWEVDDMDVMNIESNEFNVGFRGNDILLWGALPDDEDEERTARRIVQKIKLARIGKAAMKEAEQNMDKSEVIVQTSNVAHQHSS